MRTSRSWNRALRRAPGSFLMIQVLFVTIVLLAGWKPDDGEVETKKLVLMSPDGDPVVIISAIGDGGGVAINDRNGKLLVSIGGSNGEGSLSLYSSSGAEVNMQATADVGGTLRLKDSTGKVRVMAAGEGLGKLPVLLMKDPDGKVVWNALER